MEETPLIKIRELTEIDTIALDDKFMVDETSVSGAITGKSATFQQIQDALHTNGFAKKTEISGLEVDPHYTNDKPSIALRSEVLTKTNTTAYTPTQKLHPTTKEYVDSLFMGTRTFTYGVRIDTTNSNPETSVVYTDDAVGMTGGSSEWTTKFPYSEIKPCLLKNGIVQYYLNPNNYAQKADLTISDITTGADGDVMVEIPKVGYMIYKEGNYLYVKITNAENSKKYGHTRVTEGDRNKLYVGAYLGHEISGKLHSLSGQMPTVSKTIGNFRTLAQANGTGYDMLSFYPLTLLQCLYIVKYKNLNSQLALGQGFTAATNTAAIVTGGANAKGMYFGEQTALQQMKFCGIEDFWGNCNIRIDGLYSDVTRNIFTATNNFNDTGLGYIDQGQGSIANITGYTSKVQGANTTGFIQKTANGSATTYFGDYGSLAASSLPSFGGYWAYASDAGAFRLSVNSPASSVSPTVSARLMFL